MRRARRPSSSSKRFPPRCGVRCRCCCRRRRMTPGRWRPSIRRSWPCSAPMAARRSRVCHSENWRGLHAEFTRTSRFPATRRLASRRSCDCKPKGERTLAPENVLPKRVVEYIHEMGVRALDHLAANFQPAEGAAPTAVQTVVEHWKSMATEEKEEFVERVAASVVEVVAASAALPVGLALGKRVAKATKKVLKRQTKKIRKVAKQDKAKTKADDKANDRSNAGADAKPKDKKKRRRAER